MCIICEKKYDVNTTQLNCSRCRKLTRIPELPNLKSLYCYDCPMLTHIPELLNLETLWCSECPKLTHISPYPKLTYLRCSYCPKLTHIPELPKLIYLDCSRCPMLTHIPELPNLGSLYCSWCDTLTHIPELPELDTIECNNCPMLTHMDTKFACPSLLYVQCRNSPWFPIKNLDYNTNIQKLTLIQSFCKMNFRYFCFKHWIKSKDFIEFFYSPLQLGGRLEKKKTEKMLEKIKMKNIL